MCVGDTLAVELMVCDPDVDGEEVGDVEGVLVSVAEFEGDALAVMELEAVALADADPEELIVALDEREGVRVGVRVPDPDTDLDGVPLAVLDADRDRDGVLLPDGDCDGVCDGVGLALGGSPQICRDGVVRSQRIICGRDAIELQAPAGIFATVVVLSQLRGYT